MSGQQEGDRRWATSDRTLEIGPATTTRVEEAVVAIAMMRHRLDLGRRWFEYESKVVTSMRTKEVVTVARFDVVADTIESGDDPC
ncbi:hypothetical protein GUJ93_ZPchr0008g11626 [Zizania palustris]|uniref:Uncharacterized protein n=1 Tax=Zizania palustris TaxID=103762 RepID=A0A8J5RKC1_ZIZPA|nr:hypothetical protein GUJ93_ZPchr0008g11626 [Zizania palustris]